MIRSTRPRSKLAALLCAVTACVAVACGSDPGEPSTFEEGDDGAPGPTYTSMITSVEVGTVPASDYGISFAAFDVKKDANNVIQGVSGHAQLTVHAIAGQDYAIHPGPLGPETSLAELEKRFRGAASHGLVSSLRDLELPAAAFALEAPGLDLDTTPQRTVIIRNMEHGMAAYQLLSIRFLP